MGYYLINATFYHKGGAEPRQNCYQYNIVPRNVNGGGALAADAIDPGDYNTAIDGEDLELNITGDGLQSEAQFGNDLVYNGETGAADNLGIDVDYLNETNPDQPVTANGLYADLSDYDGIQIDFTNGATNALIANLTINTGDECSNIFYQGPSVSIDPDATETLTIEFASCHEATLPTPCAPMSDAPILSGVAAANLNQVSNIGFKIREDPSDPGLYGQAFTLTATTYFPPARNCGAFVVPNKLLFKIPTGTGCPCLDGVVIGLNFDGTDSWTGSQIVCGSFNFAVTFTNTQPTLGVCDFFELSIDFEDHGSDGGPHEPDVCLCSFQFWQYDSISFSDPGGECVGGIGATVGPVNYVTCCSHEIPSDLAVTAVKISGCGSCDPLPSGILVEQGDCTWKTTDKFTTCCNVESTLYYHMSCASEGTVTIGVACGALSLSTGTATVSSYSPFMAVGQITLSGDFCSGAGAVIELTIQEP